MKKDINELLEILELGLDNKPHNFEEFCINSGYPKPYKLQIDWCDRLLFKEKETRLFLGARAYGKTDYLTICGSAWKIYNDPKTTIMIFCKTQERSRSILRAIAECLEKNGVKLKKKNAKEIRTIENFGKQPTASAWSIGSSGIRGNHPQLVIMDDPITPEDTSEATRKRVKTTYSECLSLVPNILIIGQPVHKNDLYMELCDCISTTRAKWGTIKELDKDLNELRSQGMDEETIKANYFLEIADNGRLPFKNCEVVDYYPAEISQAFIDPAKEGVDYTALTIATSHFENLIVLGFAFNKSWDNALPDIIDLVRAFKVCKLGFETNGIGEFPLKFIRNELKQNSIDCRVVGMNNTENKHKRIMTAGSSKFTPYIKFSRISTNNKLYSANKLYIDFCRNYEYNVKVDDPPDSLASCMQQMNLIDYNSIKW